jgi:hypothetical protein
VQAAICGVGVELDHARILGVDWPPPREEPGPEHRRGARRSADDRLPAGRDACVVPDIHDLRP